MKADAETETIDTERRRTLKNKQTAALANVTKKISYLLWWIRYTW